MNNVVNYLVESGISLALLSLIYPAFLRKETFFWTNRIFLLGSVVFSLFLPLFHISLFPNTPVMLPEVTVTPYKNLIETVIVTGHGFTSSLESAVVSSMLAIYIYLSGVAIMTGLFIFRLIQLFNILKNGRVIPFNRGKMVLVKGDIVPFSFLNYLFLPENFEETPGYQRIVAHESEHINQKHTYDVLLCELLVILQWFNPFIWLLRREIRENHEYLADRGVLRSGVQPGEYKLLLLAQVAGPQIYVANHFNFSLLKSRMRMITRNRSSKAALTKTIFGLIMAAGLIVTFACERKEFYMPEETAITTTNSDKEDEIFRVVDIMPVFPGGESAMRQYIARSVNYPVIARELGIQGKVFVSFVINKEGWVKDIKVIRSVEPSLDQEAVRAVMTMPQWEPGRHEGKRVQVAYTVPISFVLQ